MWVSGDTGLEDNAWKTPAVSTTGFQSRWTGTGVGIAEVETPAMSFLMAFLPPPPRLSVWLPYLIQFSPTSSLVKEESEEGVTLGMLYQHGKETELLIPTQLIKHTHSPLFSLSAILKPAHFKVYPHCTYKTFIFNSVLSFLAAIEPLNLQVVCISLTKKKLKKKYRVNFPPLS